MELKDGQGMFCSCGIGFSDELSCLYGYNVMTNLVE